MDHYLPSDAPNHVRINLLFENVVEASIPIKIDRGLYPNFDPTKTIHEIPNDLDVLLDRNHPYGKYEERLSLFWANRKSSSV